MKKGTGITIDEDLWEMVKRNEELNLSALLNKLLRNYFSMGMNSTRAALETQIKTLRDRREKHEQEIREIDAALKSLGGKFEEAEKAESELDRDLGRFVNDGGAIKELSGSNYAYFMENYRLSKDEIDEKLEEIAEPRRKRSVGSFLRKEEKKTEPPSQGEIAIMEQLNIPFEPGISKREANELIKKAVQERGQ